VAAAAVAVATEADANQLLRKPFCLLQKLISTKKLFNICY